ncbi:MAG: mucoidy inhibitor MuiA family protein [Candidatus Kryptonium sp.]
MSLILSFAFFAFMLYLAGDAVKSKITSVVIYRDDAFITKTISALVEKGENQIKIDRLTPDLLDQSVQVEILKGKDVKISDVKVEETYLEKPEVEKVEKLKAKLDSLNDLINSKKGEIEVILGEIEFLKKLPPTLQGQKLTTVDLENYFKFYGKWLSESMKKKTKLEKELEKLNREKKLIENELNQLSSTKERSKSIQINLLSASKGEVEIKVAYLVSGATWKPGYEVRANSNAGKVDLNLFAFVRQSTGEDWIDVPIEIGTAPVFISGTPPELYPWYVDVYHPRPERKVLKQEPRILEMPMPSIFIAPEVEVEMTSVSFKLPKSSVPSDNQFHKIFLSSFSQDVKFTYYAVPKLSKYAYLTANLKNEFNFPILPGEAGIYIDGKYISTSSLKKILPDEMFDLFLGVDEDVRIERKLKRKFTEFTSFGRNKKIHYEYEIKVKNGKGRDITIEVRDNYPISRNEKIKVVLESPSEGEAKIDAEGIIVWTINLKPAEEKTLSVRFYVEHPKDLPVSGLE